MKQRIAFALIMGVITTGLISFTLIAVYTGFVKNFFYSWGRSWLISYFIVIPTILIIGPKIQQLVEKLFASKKMQSERSK